MRLLSNLTDWPDVRARILERELQTGQDYRELMLTLGLSSGQITVEDLLAFVDTGLSMPEGALHLLALHGRAEDIASLALRAPFPDLNARHPVTGNTAVGALIQHYGMTPNPDPAAAVAALRSLVELGIDTRQADGELDLLSMIFLHTRRPGEPQTSLRSVSLTARQRFNSSSPGFPESRCGAERDIRAGAISMRYVHTMQCVLLLVVLLLYCERGFAFSYFEYKTPYSGSVMAEQWTLDSAFVIFDDDSDMTVTGRRVRFLGFAEMPYSIAEWIVGGMRWSHG